MAQTPFRGYGQFREKLEARSDSGRVFVDRSIPFTYRLNQEGFAFHAVRNWLGGVFIMPLSQEASASIPRLEIIERLWHIHQANTVTQRSPTSTCQNPPAFKRDCVRFFCHHRFKSSDILEQGQLWCRHRRMVQSNRLCIMFGEMTSTGSWR